MKRIEFYSGKSDEDVLFYPSRLEAEDSLEGETGSVREERTQGPLFGNLKAFEV